MSPSNHLDHTANAAAGSATAPAPATAATPIHEAERLRRWRLVLGGEADSSCGKLAGESADIDQALAALYDADGKSCLGKPTERRGGRDG